MSLLGWIETCNVKMSCQSHYKNCTIIRDLNYDFIREITRLSDIPQSRQIYP